MGVGFFILIPTSRVEWGFYMLLRNNLILEEYTVVRNHIKPALHLVAIHGQGP